MYVLTHNDQVLLGPIQWNSRMFNAVIEDDTEIITHITPSDVSTVPIDLGNGLMIRACSTDHPPLNTKTQMYQGPFWTFTATTGLASFTVVDKPIDLVNKELKEVLANERWKKEQAGTTVVIQGQTVNISTDRVTRDQLAVQLLLMGDNDTISWKFDSSTWLTLSKNEIASAVAAGRIHIQTQFDWEANVITQIDAVNTHAELDSIAILPVAPSGLGNQ